METVIVLLDLLILEKEEREKIALHESEARVIPFIENDSVGYYSKYDAPPHPSFPHATNVPLHLPRTSYAFGGASGSPLPFAVAAAPFAARPPGAFRPAALPNFFIPDSFIAAIAFSLNKLSSASFAAASAR